MALPKVKIALVFLAVVLGSLEFHSSSAQDRPDSYTIGPAPAWVQRADVPKPDKNTNHSDGVSFLLLDRQIDLQSESVYERQVKRITSETGLRNESQLEFTFEPSHQSLVLHEIILRRNGEAINRLKPEMLRVLQRERDSFRQIYDGEVAVHAVLEDVRVGDEIEHSSTVRGFNPIFEKSFFDSSLIQYSVPVLENRLRVISSKSRPQLQHRLFRRELQPEILEEAARIDYRWVFRDLPPITPEDTLPDWYHTYPWIQFSEYRDWSQVRDWAIRHYGSIDDLSPDALDLVNRVKQENTTPENQVLATLKFVQEEVRYLGIEIGANSHKPHHPSIVFARRFGDCKDKTVLLCAMLRRLGVEAHAALINTYSADRVSERLPSPLAFDHVIARVKVAGETYWLDPTLTHQRGSLRDVSVDDYQRALVVHPEETDLVSIPRKARTGPLKIVNERLTVQAYGGPARLQVETIFNGRSADSMRRYTSRTMTEEIQKEYLNYYLRSFSGVTNTEPLKISDDTQANRLTVLENYFIETLWEKPENATDDYETSFDASAILEATALPRISDRTMPLGLNLPTHIRHELSIDLPYAGEFPDENKAITDEFQKFQFTAKQKDTNLLLTFEYETLADSVPAEKVSAYLKNLNEIRSICTYDALFPQDGASDSSAGIHWPSLVIAIMTVLILTFVGVQLYRWRPAPPANAVPPVLADANLQGLGGWLVLVAFGMMISPIGIITTSYQALPAYSAQSWHYLTHPESSGYHWLYAPMLIGELIGNLTLLAFVCLLLVLFFQKRMTFPRLYIAFLLFNLCYQFADLAAMRAIPDLAKDMTARDYKGPFRALSGTIIWTAYMLKSKRVKATFVR